MDKIDHEFDSKARFRNPGNQMTTAITTTQAFQERIFAKIREQIGDLMTDDDLKNLVEASMQKAFFEPVKSTNDYGRTILDKPSLFVSMIEELLRERVQTAVAEWVTNNPEAITKALQETLAMGIPKLVLNYFEQKTQWPMHDLAQKLTQKGFL